MQSHGISAASGKLGAIIASAAYPPLNAAYGIQTLFAISATFMAAGAAFTLLLPETRGKSIDELSDENKARQSNGSA